ncbi:CCA tRNA nucleotidyltransferase, partial [Candidatus Peregrinibacteria bacterium]|nr:CCA tRNA nucleotidyltransferase [Candidatus Peregrinibacteria bacterium]
MLENIARYLLLHDIKSYVCGGTARDLKLSRTIMSYDFAVVSNMQELQAKFKNKIKHSDPFLTYVTIMYKGLYINLYPLKKVTLDNTYYKFEYTTSLKEDSNSRDFTINALYFDPLKNKWYDYHNGKKDIENKLIRFVGNPYNRILESKIRILRGPVLAGVLGTGWKLEHKTHEAIKDYRLKLALTHSTQVYREVNKIFTRVEIPSKVFNILRSTKVLDDFFPELLLCVGIEQTNKRKNLDVYQHLMYAIDSVKLSHPRCKIIRTTALLHDIGKPQCMTYNTKNEIHFYGHEKASSFLAERILFKWGFKKDFIRQITSLINLHLFDASRRLSSAAVRRLINRASPENIHNLIDLRIADRYGTGRPGISMDKEEYLRDRINKELENISPNDFKLVLPNDQIISMIKDTTDNPDAALPYIRQYLKNK